MIREIAIGLKSLAGESANPPFLKNLSSHLLVEINSIHIPIEHDPLDPSIAHLHRLLSHCTEQHLPETFPPVTLPYEQVLNVKPGFRKEGRVVREEEDKPGDGDPFLGPKGLAFRVLDGEVEVDGSRDRGECQVRVRVQVEEGATGDLKEEDSERLEGRGVKESGREGGLGGGAEMGQPLEDGHLVYLLVDVGDVRRRGEADPGEERVEQGAVLRQCHVRRRSRGRRRRRGGSGHC